MDFYLEVVDTISVALETNGKGFIGFLVDFPGAFVRGRDEEETLVRVGSEFQSYLRWLGVVDRAARKSRSFRGVNAR